MRSMVALARELSKTVVAEGVERADEATFLRSIGCEYAQGYHFGEPILDRAVMQLLNVVRRSDAKMQPRGFFRPKQKNAAKDVTAKPSRTVPANGASPKSAALPSGSVVRQRQRPSNDKARVNGVVNGAAPFPDAEKTSAGLLQEAVTNGNPPPPPPMLAPPRPHRHQMSPQKSASAAKPVSPPPPAANVHNFARAGLPKPGPELTLDGLRPNIVTPLAEALVRASANLAPVQPPQPQPQFSPSASMSPPVPPRDNGPVVLPVNRRRCPSTARRPAKSPVSLSPSTMPASTQPDFSSLPPSIAKSLARLAGTAPAARTEDKGAGSDAPMPERKIASNAGSGVA